MHDLDNKLPNKNLSLGDLLNLDAVSKCLKDFEKIVQLSMAVKDVHGNMVLTTGMQDICSNFHKVNQETKSNCLRSDVSNSIGVSVGEYKIYKCLNGLYDMVTPIIIEDEHIGNIFVGQFLIDNDLPNLDFCRAQAAKYGFDAEGYIDALMKLPVLSRDSASEIMTFISEFANILSSIGMKNLNLKRSFTEKNALFESLKKSEENYRLLVEYQSDYIIKVDLNGYFSYVSPSFCELLGIEEKELLGMHSYSTIHEEDRSLIIGAVKELTNPPYQSFHEERTKTKNGLRWLQWINKAVFDENGKVIAAIGIGRDIDDKKKLEKRLLANQALQSAMVENILDVVMIADEDLSIKYLSPNIKKLFGLEQDEMLGKNAFERLHPDDIKRATRLVRKLLAENCHSKSGEFKFSSKNSGFRDVYITAVNLISDPNVNGLLINFHDITEQKIRIDKIKYLSHRDVLTNLYNRTYYEAELKRLDAKKIFPVSVIIGDVDGLKLINDGFGHSAGDNILKRIAEIFSECIASSGAAFRFAGDEFYAILPGVEIKTAKNICKEIRKKLELENSNNSKMIALSLSLGYDTKTQSTEPLTKVFKRAESFMYRHKLLVGRSHHGTLLNSIKTAMNIKSRDTEEHEERIVSLAHSLGKKMNVGDEKLNQLNLLATLHDIGKMSIDKHILNKKSKLTESEWFEIKKHPEAGYRIAMSSPELMQIADLILSHHERWDGNGYPQGLKGEAIPLLSRIVAVVDAFDAITSDRPYSKARTKEAAIEEIIKNSGTQFDPAVVEAFLRIV